MPSYPTSCPSCGKQLEPVRGQSADTPPWVCNDDARAWWPAELTPAARRLWRPEMRDFGPTKSAAVIHEQALVNREKARERGQGSNSPDHPVRD